MGFFVTDSKANFLFARHESLKAKEIFLRLKDEGIYVRHFDRDRIDDFLRISIGTDSQMDTLCEKLKEMVAD